MTKFFLAVILILLAAILVLFLLWRLAVGRQRRTEKALDTANRQLGEAVAQQAKLEGTIDILRQNRKEADEKIDSLHSGSSIDNALDELHKREP